MTQPAALPLRSPAEPPFIDGARACCLSGARGLPAALAPDSARAAVLDARALLEGIFALEPPSFLRRMPGRETFSWPGGPGEAGFVVKRYVGGDPRDAWYERLRGRGTRSPARRECENLQGLAAAGLSVPPACLWVEERGRAARSAVVMGRVVHSRTLRAVLAEAEPRERRRLVLALASLVARLHRLGWYHRDLYLQHLVVAQDGAPEEPTILDVGRARNERAPRRRWFVKDLAALAHSAPGAVTAAEGMRFLDAYLDGRGLARRRARHGWRRAVVAKARRIAAHAPRHVDPSTAGVPS